MSTKEQDHEISFCLLSAALQKMVSARSCDEVVVVLDQFARAVDQGENVLLFMPLIKQHLDICPACREKYEALLMILQPSLE